MNWYQMISTLLQLTQVLELMGVFSDSIMIYFLKPVRKIFSSSNQGPLLTHENWDFVTLSVCRAGRHGWRLTRSLKNTFLMFLEIKLSGNQIFLKRFLAPFSTFSGNAVFQMFCYSHIYFEIHTLQEDDREYFYSALSFGNFEKKYLH